MNFETLMLMLQRIERKLDALIFSLAEEGEDEGVTSLDGKHFPPRDDSKGLG